MVSNILVFCNFYDRMTSSMRGAWIFSLDTVHRFAHFYQAVSFGSILSASTFTIREIYLWQGNRTANVGIVDSEYVIHLGLPTLGGSAGSKVNGLYIYSTMSL